MQQLAVSARLDQADVLQAGEQSPHRAGDMAVRVKDHVHVRGPACPQFDQRGRDGLKALAPAFTPVAGDEQALEAGIMNSGWRKRRLGAQQSVDPSIAGHMDFTAHLLSIQVRCGELCRREKEVRVGVDRGAIFLLGPGKGRVVGPQARFDVGNVHTGNEPRERSTERTGRIALHHDQVRRIPQQRLKRFGDGADMEMRILLPRAAELQVWVAP